MIIIIITQSLTNKFETAHIHFKCKPFTLQADTIEINLNNCCCNIYIIKKKPLELLSVSGKTRGIIAVM